MSLDELSSQNPKSIRDMFGAIASKYDLANTVLSFGIHHRWKKRLIQESEVQPHHQILDCATGTGDLAFEFESRLGKTGCVIASDFCDGMLHEAQKKALQRGSQVRFDLADVMDLKYADRQFDIASISFGIRNVKDPLKALSELGRVVKPGGRVLVLEFGQPRSKWISKLYAFYSNIILPRIGGWISGQPQAYQYLQTSSAVFPCREEFVKIAESTGFFKDSKVISLQFGIAYLYLLNRSSHS